MTGISGCPLLSAGTTPTPADEGFGRAASFCAVTVAMKRKPRPYYVSITSCLVPSSPTALPAAAIQRERAVSLTTNATQGEIHRRLLGRNMQLLKQCTPKDGPVCTTVDKEIFYDQRTVSLVYPGRARSVA